MNIIKRILMGAALISIVVFTGCESSIGGMPATEIEDGLSSDYFIKSLSFSDGTLKYPFNSEDWINYLEVPYTTDSISVTTAANHPWSEIFIGDEKLYDNSASSPIPLSVGSNTIQIKVIAEDGQELIYTIYVIRCSENYSVAALSELAINGTALTPAFNASGTNRNFTATTTASVISLVAVPEVESEGARVEVRVNNVKITDTSAISLNQGTNTIKTKGIAPDGKTEDSYTITIIRQIESPSSKLAVLSIAGGNFDHEFNPDITSYTIDVSSTMNPVNLTAVAESADSTVSIKLNGSDVSDRSSIPLSPGVTSVISVIVTASDGGTNTYTINANSLQGSDNANLSGITVMMGTKSYRPIYPGSFERGSSYHNPEQTGFSSTVYKYCTVVYGFDSIQITATAEDSTVKAISFTSDGTTVSSDLSNGTAAAAIPLKYGLVTKIDISVVAGDNITQKNYTVYAKLLNIDEFYWGIYAPSLDKSKSGRWEPKPSAGGNAKSVTGLIGGSMKWSITLSPTSTIALTNYNDGKLGFKYNDGGFIANGTQEAKLDGVATKDGYNCTKPGTIFYVRTAEGEDAATLGYHIKVDGGETVEASDSYTDITYMGITNRQIFKSSKPYPFSDSYDWNTSWNDGQ